MFSKKFTTAFLFGSLVFSGLFAAEPAKTVKPVWNKDQITCGAKTVKFTQNGRVTVFSGKTELLHFNISGELNLPDKKVDWNNFDIKKSKMVKNDKGITWELYRVCGKECWKGMDQTAEITPDGLIKISYKLIPTLPKGMAWRNKSVWFTLPAPLYKDKKAIYNGKEVLLNEKLNVNDYYTAKSEFMWTFGKGTPDSVTIKAPKLMKGMNSRMFVKTHFTLWYSLLDNDTGALLLDIR